MCAQCRQSLQCRIDLRDHDWMKHSAFSFLSLKKRELQGMQWIFTSCSCFDRTHLIRVVSVSHFGEICKQCMEPFSCRIDLRGHKRMKHGVFSFLSLKRRELQGVQWIFTSCSCTDWTHLIWVGSVSHFGENCKQCKKPFLCRIDLRDHLRIQHGDIFSSCL